MRTPISVYFLRATIIAIGGAVLAPGIAAGAPLPPDVVDIYDLTPGATPTVQVFDASGNDVTGSRVTILSDSGPDFVHFKLLDGLAGTGDIGYTDFFSDFVGGTLDARLVIFDDPNSLTSGLDIEFGSFPDTPSNAGATFHFSDDAVVTGALQIAGEAANAFNEDGLYQFYVELQAPPTGVPEPASLAVFGLGAAMLLGARRRRKA